ncbi:sulfatase-like hydrolase/transferase [Reichenbachiella sp.]|uniref:sulfatase-like hydrolase/transferase n=1 Tax=Reichenbachiella sp. TaxID=2184521 RepID=UPI00329A497D
MKKIGMLTLLICLIQGVNAQQNNVLFIAVDDLKPLIGAYGDPIAITPNIDRLAAMGTTFTNAHCQQAICGPTRASLLTGMRPDVTEVWDLSTQMRAVNPNILTIPQQYSANGYTAAAMGKIFDSRNVASGHDPESWSEPFIQVGVNHPIYGKDSYGYQSPEYTHIIDSITALGVSEGVTAQQMGNYVRARFKPSTESTVVISDDGYRDGAVATRAVSKLSQLSTQSTPFFLAVGFNKPHLPFVAPKQYWDMYNRASLPLAAFQDKSVNGGTIPYSNLGEFNTYTDIPESFGTNGMVNEAKQRELIHGYYACISYIDAQIGKMLDQLEATGTLNSTTIILWGDHGFHLGDHGQWCKHTNFEQATRSPLIIASPGMLANTTNSSPVEFVDVFPTLVDLSGLPQISYLQGESLKPILNGTANSVKSYAVSQYPRWQKMGYAIRTSRYRYVVWYDDTSGGRSASEILFRELYDYDTDPNETVNIVDSNPLVATELQATLDSFFARQTQEKADFKNALANLVLNPGFEEGLTGWTTAGQCPIEISSFNVRSGNSSLKFTGTSCNAYQIVNGLKPNTTYTARAHIKTENGEAAFLKVKDYGGLDVQQRDLQSWYNEVAVEFTTGATNTSARIVLGKYFQGAIGKTWFDDISLTEGSQSTARSGEKSNSTVNTENNGLFSLYPNPVVNGVLRLDWTNVTESVTVNILDYSGKEILKREFRNVSSALLDMNGLSGVYIVRLNLDGKVSTGKITIEE